MLTRTFAVIAVFAAARSCSEDSPNVGSMGVPGMACTSNDQCQSHICGIGGSGNCCSAPCSTTDTTCGATACDGTGACVYPAATVGCGFCAGSMLTTAACSGSGACTVSSHTPCPNNLACKDATSCRTQCAVAGDCASGFCDSASSTCCLPLGNGGTLNVDGANGNDVGCCGYGMANPCRTLTRAMQVIDAAQATNVTISATVDGGGGDWPWEESYPVTLGWGVELHAPGVYFLDPDGGYNTMLDVTFYSSNDTVGYASIDGTAADPIGVGMNTSNTQMVKDSAAISIESGNTLYLANANVNGSNQGTANGDAILVNGATLVLGTNRSGTDTGTVFIGNALGVYATNGWIGVDCQGTAASPSTVLDAPLDGGQSSVVIQGQSRADIFAWRYCSVTLTSSPVLGTPPSGLGSDGCGDAKQDREGIDVYSDNDNVTLRNATIQCQSDTAVYGEGWGVLTGNPLITIDNTVMQNNSWGVYAIGGASVKVTGSTIRYNYIGVQQSSDGVDGTVDLSGGGNSVVCSRPQNVYPGVDVYNTSNSVLNASNVAWDTSGPDYFTCDRLFNCVCDLASCTVSPGSSGMDAVTIDAGVTTTGNTLSAWALDAGCG